MQEKHNYMKHTIFILIILFGLQTIVLGSNNTDSLFMHLEKLPEKQQADTLKKIINFNESILNSKFNVLSGGERQRIAVIGVLLLNKPFYIFDEITSALDKKNINSLISLIMEDEERTVISVSHNIEWEKYSTRIIKMENGAIIEDRNI